MQIYHVKGFLPPDLSNPHKQNGDFALQIYGGCALATGILKTSHQINISGQPCKNIFENIYTTYTLLPMSFLPGSIVINDLQKHATSRYMIVTKKKSHGYNHVLSIFVVVERKSHIHV